MSTHLYLSLVPEAFIASMLDPEAFGAYYACGTMKKAHGQAMFVEVDPAFRSRDFRIAEALERCKPHEDGRPKSSVYIAVYRVAERIPVSALGALHLTTSDGRVLALEKREAPEDVDEGLRLYQELSPTRPLVASTKPPMAFYRHMTDASANLFALPALHFADLRLDSLATDPESGGCDDLPYANMDHLRQCLSDIRATGAATKIVDRNHSVAFPYRLVRSGFYFGNGAAVAHYAMPGREALLEKHYDWCRSSQV